VDVYDPWANPIDVKHEYLIDTMTTYPDKNGYNAIILVVAHKEFLKIDLQKHRKSVCIIYDVKNLLRDEDIDARL
jgi:UDP-N-acetyl-D-galactosamine dehydrogenase